MNSGSRPRASAADHAWNRLWSSTGTPSMSQMMPHREWVGEVADRIDLPTLECGIEQFGHDVFGPGP